MKKKFLFVFLLALFGASASAAAENPKSLLIEGRKDLDAGRYDGAVAKLSGAYEGMQVVGDYVLFWISKACRELGNFSESNSRIKELLKTYQDSPLRKKARSLEIKNIISASPEDTPPDLIRNFESYVEDYPEDREMKFLFAQALKKKGESAKAKALFKDVYVSGNGIFSRMAYNEIMLSDLTLQDMIERASNLLEVAEFREAELMLKNALLKDDGKHSAEILKKLGYSVYRQKRYREAAELYDKAGDNYSKAKALYRAGDKDALDLVVKKLVSSGDRRVASILILTASEKRRNGETDEAIKIYENVKANYPSEAEDSLWGMGWTYFRKGDFKKALDVFAELCSRYAGTKYLYWKARALEGTGKDAGYIYRQLGKEPDFYSLLAQIKNSEQNADQPGAKDFISLIRAMHSASASDPEIKPFQSERIDILLELGMNAEAAGELSAMARKTTDMNSLAAISLKMHEAEEYRLPLILMLKMPCGEAPHEILYPLAYWPYVKDASERYGVDPFLVLSVMREESRFDPDARSQAGALGLMQLMPQTAFLIDKKLNLGAASREKIYDAEININFGSYYINSLIKDFGSLPAAIAAYNAGDDIVRQWLKTGGYKSHDEFIEDIPYDETRNFVKRVITSYSEYRRYAAGEEKSLTK